MKEQIPLTQNDYRKLFHKLLKVCEPERLILGELGFLQLLTGKSDQVCFAKQVSGLGVHFAGLNVYYVTIDGVSGTRYYNPRNGVPIREAATRWNQMIQERISNQPPL